MGEKHDSLVRASSSEPTDEPGYSQTASMDMTPLMVPRTPKYLTSGTSRTLIVGAVVHGPPDRSMSYLLCPLIFLLVRSRSEILISSAAICARRHLGRPCLLLLAPVQLVLSPSSEGDTEIENRTARAVVSDDKRVAGSDQMTTSENQREDGVISRTIITEQVLVRKMWL